MDLSLLLRLLKRDKDTSPDPLSSFSRSMREVLSLFDIALSENVTLLPIDTSEMYAKGFVSSLEGYLSLALPASERKNSRYVLRIAKPLVDDTADTGDTQRVLLREDTLSGTRYIAFEEHTKLEEYASRYRRSDGLFRGVFSRIASTRGKIVIITIRILLPFPEGHEDRAGLRGYIPHARASPNRAPPVNISFETWVDPYY